MACITMADDGFAFGDVAAAGAEDSALEYSQTPGWDDVASDFEELRQ